MAQNVRESMYALLPSVDEHHGAALESRTILWKTYQQRWLATVARFYREEPRYTNV
jgi:hypothetical protein